MIKINDILKLINEGFKTHYFKDIKTNLIAELVVVTDQEGEEREVPAIYEGSGNYRSLQDDNNGLNIYHRIEDFKNDEDPDAGFGRNSLTTENYSMKAVFFGQQPAIEDSCEDINFPLSKEFKKLIPRSFDLQDTNRISVTGIEYDREKIKKEEGLEFSPESVFFVISYEVMIKSLEECNELKCSQL